MPWWVWILIALAVLVLLALVAWSLLRARRRQRLQERFGPEYDRTVAETGKRRRAEAELEEREERRAELDIRPLPPAARDRYSDSWRRVQERFVDEPSSAVAEADRLVADVMRERGYPVEDFEQRAADVSVDHPHVVEHYRAAHAVYVKDARGGAETEELRQGFVHYRALFEELLEADGDEPSEGRGEPAVVREETRVRKVEEEPLDEGEQPGATTKRGPTS